MKISILTATYNRANLLPNLYESINQNRKSFDEFEWIIIDDGSTDNTKELIQEWISVAPYPIHYIYQENQGKMKAINRGIKKVSGDIIIEVDSDDILLPNSLKRISDDYQDLKEEAYGIIYKRKIIGLNTNVVGLDQKVLKLFDIHNKYGYDFDMALTFKSEVRKKYFYELEDSEKFVTESRLYYKLDQIYEGMLFQNYEIVESEYQEDGYSKNINQIFKKYPKGYYQFFLECLSYCKKDTLYKKRYYFLKHYILFSFLTGKTKKECINNVTGWNKLFVMLLVIPGYWKSKRF